MLCERLEIEVADRKIENAVEKALDHFGCTRAEVDIEVLQASRKGILGFLKKDALVRVRLTDRSQIGAFVCQRLLEGIGFEASVEASAGRDQTDIDIRGDEPQMVIGRKGQTLDALQYLTVALTDRVTDDRTALLLDCDSYRQKRRASIMRLGRRLSSQVNRSGKSVTVQPMPPQERKILHQALEQDDTVDVRSVGQGFERKMQIFPRRG